MKKLILIRHGETDCTAQAIYCGHDDIPLNANGKKQAHLLKKRLSSLAVDAIYSSDLKRASETANIVFPGKTITKLTCLREIDLGNFSGLGFSEIEKRYPDACKAWISDPLKAQVPGGESVADFAKRAGDCFKDLFKKNPGKKIAVVTHGGTIRIILLAIQNKDASHVWSIEQDTTALNIVEFGENGHKITVLNDTSHLGSKK